MFSVLFCRSPAPLIGVSDWAGVLGVWTWTVQKQIAYWNAWACGATILAPSENAPKYVFRDPKFPKITKNGGGSVLILLSLYFVFFCLLQLILRIKLSIKLDCWLLQLSLLNIGCTRAPSQRRMADVRSLGYSELFVLSKDDLWDVLEEFPEAKAKMIELGKERLRQDGLLADEVSLFFSRSYCYSMISYWHHLSVSMTLCIMALRVDVGNQS